MAHASRGTMFRLRNLLAKLRFPNTSSCYRCDGSWEIVEEHFTMYTPAMGCFPLCQYCWEELETPSARLPYYHELFDRWSDFGMTSEEDWTAIERAVMAGK